LQRRPIQGDTKKPQVEMNVILTAAVFLASTLPLTEKRLAPVDNSSAGQLWIANPANPYDQYGMALRNQILSTNTAFSTQVCRNEQSCKKAWTQKLNTDYHANPSAYLTLDKNKINWGTKEEGYRTRIGNALLLPNGTQRLQQLRAMETEVSMAYGPSATEQETQKLMLLLLTNVKYMSYTLQTEGMVIGSGPQVANLTLGAVDGCMTNKINSAGPLEICINYGAGPGGWVLVAYVDCLLS
jgi:hypothetical protein